MGRTGRSAARQTRRAGQSLQAGAGPCCAGGFAAPPLQPGGRESRAGRQCGRGPGDCRPAAAGSVEAWRWAACLRCMWEVGGGHYRVVAVVALQGSSLCGSWSHSCCAAAPSPAGRRAPYLKIAGWATGSHPRGEACRSLGGCRGPCREKARLVGWLRTSTRRQRASLHCAEPWLA